MAAPIRFAPIPANDNEARSGKILRAPSPRIQTAWTPQLIKAAERQAENGNLALAASVIDGLLLSDDRVRGCISTRVSGLFSLPVEFEAAGDRRRSTQTVKALEAGEDYWQCFPEEELFQIKAWAILLGVGPGINRWTEHDGRAVPNLHFWHPSSLTFDERRNGWFTRTTSNEELPVVAGDGSWFLHCPYGSTRPWSLGLWRALSFWVLLKAYARDDWGRASEKASQIVVTDTKGSGTKELRHELAEGFFEAARDGAIILPEGFDAKGVFNTADTAQIYGAQIEAANTAISIAIKGNNLSTEVAGGGSYAATSVHREVDLVFLRSDDESLSRDLHDEELIHYARHNFGDERLAPWPFHRIEVPEDIEKAATVSLQASDLLDRLEKQGFEVDEKAWADRFGLGEIVKGRKAEEDRPKPPPPPAPPGAPSPKNDPPAPSEENPDEPSTENRSRRSAQAKVERGHIDGQVYADELIERAKKTQAAKPDLSAIFARIDQGGDFDEVRALLAGYLGEDADPSEMSELLSQVFILSELAGRYAVHVDTPKD